MEVSIENHTRTMSDTEAVTGVTLFFPQVVASNPPL